MVAMIAETAGEKIPDAVAWAAENPWYNTDAVLTRAAMGVHQGLLAAEPGLTVRQNLERVTANQPEKAELVMAQLNQINDERIPRLVELQDNSERVIVQASRRSDVNVSEALVAWKLANQELALILKAKQDNRGQPVDGGAAVDKINVTQQTVDRVISEKWEYTSPQGREIIRKKVWEVKREMEISQAAAQAADAEKTPPAPA